MKSRLMDHASPSGRLRGVDPFDALRGTRVPLFVRRIPRLRQLAIQMRKRLPLPTAAAYGLEPFVMAKTVGCMLSKAARMGARDEADGLAELLTQTDGHLGSGAWGYEFDVQTRWTYYPAGTPNLIATVFVARGEGAAGMAFGEDAWVHEMVRSAAFVREHLVSAGEAAFVRYTPLTPSLVHNANLLGAALLATSGVLSGRDEWLQTAMACSRTTIESQRADGSWPYGADDGLGWSDSFHTAYNLDGLLHVWLASGDRDVRASLDLGVDRWAHDFFGINGEPKYYPRKAFPYDIHSAGTAVDVASRLATWGWPTAELAERVLRWTARRLVNGSDGSTFYQAHRLWTDRRHFVRWGDAHWALGESAFGLLAAGRRDPLEEEVARRSGRVPL
jgi:hypothetical protein